MKMYTGEKKNTQLLLAGSARCETTYFLTQFLF